MRALVASAPALALRLGSDDGLCPAKNISATAAGARARHHERAQTAKETGPGGQGLRLEATQRTQDVLGSCQITTERLLQNGCVTDDVGDGGLAAVEPFVDARIKKTADDPTGHDDEHDTQRHITVEGAEFEIAVKQDHRRAENAQQHMQSKPVGNPSQMPQ